MLRDVESAPVSDAERALLRFVEKVNRESTAIGPADITTLHAAGWSDEAIYDAISVCGLFHFYNVWIDATGVHPMTEEEHRAAAPRMASGYIRSSSTPAT